MTRRSAIWLLPLALALHNLEEGVFFPRYLRRFLGMLPADARDWIGPVSSQQMVPACYWPPLSRSASAALGVMLLGRTFGGSA